jgi:hypothetical protein
MNIASSTSSSACELASAGWMGDTGSLVLSIVVTLILVGALFYYVKQRFEVLESSQKEQIHVMQSFIASIGEQFHRMNVYIQHKLGFTNEVKDDLKQHQSHQQQQHANLGSSRIDISDDDTKVIRLRSSISGSGSDSESESESVSDSGSETESETESESDSSSDGGESNDSKSSNTTRESWMGSKQYKQIKIHDMETNSAEVDNTEIDNDDGIKIVEINPQFISSSSLSTHNRADGSDTGSESDSDSSSDSGSEAGSAASDTENMIQDIHVIKIESEDLNSGPEKEAAGSSEKDKGNENGHEKELEKEKGTQKKTLVLDLEKEEVSAPSAGVQYSSLSIKQLRQLVKKKSILPHGENEISKMKREQLIELLASSSNE